MILHMAYVNVLEWSPEHVAEWLRGLEYSLLPYVQFFLNNGIDGQHLLNLTANDLEDLHVFKIGHQTLILEAVELLRQLHYNLSSETLQSLAVKLSCKARSLHNDLKLNGPRDQNNQQERVSMNVLSSVSEVLTSVKSLVSWLDRLPFQQDPVCIKLKKTVLRLSIELASTTQRDQFAEKPHTLIKKNSAQIAELCDQFVQNSMDSLILQPASLDIAVIKKKPDEELGIHIKSTYSGVHIIGGIKDQSPTKLCNKVEKGDEIVQVNYQTIIGWQQKKLVSTMTEHSTELQLTLKKRPRHINMLGEVIILRPYRIPSKKTSKNCYNWPDDGPLSPLEVKSSENECERNDFQDDDSAFLPISTQLQLSKDFPMQYRLIENTTSTGIQRRATVSGASPIILKSPVSIDDLVNGIFSTKLTDHYGRSISHDSSRKAKAPELVNISIGEHERYLSSSKENLADNLFKEFNNNSIEQGTPFPFKSGQTCDGKENDSASFATNVSPMQKENFRHSNGINQGEADRRISLEKSDSSLSVSDGRNGERSSTLMYNWGHERMEFQGRRPSAHDLANEIAGNKETDIDPVFLRKATKLESSPAANDVKVQKQTEDTSSYQVVIVGGVPQRCVPGNRDDKNKISTPLRNKPKSLAERRNRRISCRDLGEGDCEGWLYRQKERKGLLPTIHQWTKRWIVLKDYFLYIYKDKSDTKAECLISLPGSVVSPVIECKTKKFAFKICRQQMNFYLATESKKDLTNWMNKISLAAIAYHPNKDVTTYTSLKSDSSSNQFYSETDDSENGSPTLTRRIACEGEKNAFAYESLLSNQKWGKTTYSGYKNVPTAEEELEVPQYNNRNFSSSSVFHRNTENTVPKSSNTLSVHPFNDSFSSGSSINNYSENSISSSYNVTSSSIESNIHLNGEKRCAIGRSKNPPQYDSTGACLRTSDRSALAAEYDAATSSLGRPQKPVVKEIAPGLVARMAVSYTNLSKNNGTGGNKLELSKSVSSPRYVTKISDSYNYLVRNSNKLPDQNSSWIKKDESYGCKRSASESQVTKTDGAVSKFSNSLSNEMGNEDTGYRYKQINLPHREQKVFSLLDREYNKVFEGKKVSQHQLKSTSNQNKLLQSIKTEQRVAASHSESFHSINLNQNIKNSFSDFENVSASRYDHKNISNKGFSLPSGGNVSDEFHYQYGHSNQLKAKILSSCSRLKSFGFNSEDSIKSEDSGSKISRPSLVVDSGHCGNSVSSCELNDVSEATSSDVDSPKMAFKFFNSPKFMKKLTSPKVDKKNIFKIKKQAKEQKKSIEQQKENKLRQNEKKFFGSPKLVRSFFSSPKTEKKVVTVSSSVQTDIALMPAIHADTTDRHCDFNSNKNTVELELTPSVTSRLDEEVNISKSSSNSSLTSSISNFPFTNSVYYVEAKIEPQITITLPLVPDNKSSPVELSRTPLKPMMGVAMLGKKRLPSVSGESTISASSKHSQDISSNEANEVLSEISMEIKGDDYEFKGDNISVPNFDESEDSQTSFSEVV